MKVYTGIGSRETPRDILYIMQDFALELAGRAWTLRSGCAPGADSAFEEGAFSAYFANSRRPKPELYLPWPRFEGRRKAVVSLEQPQPEAYSIAEQFHPAWTKCSPAARSLHARNVHQILGADVTRPVLSRFVICWTFRGEGGGGTGQALRIAHHYNIPIFDLANQADYERIAAGLFA